MEEWMEEGGVKLYDMMVATTKPMALKSVVLLRIPDIIATYGYVSDDGETSKSLSVKEIASHISLPPPNMYTLSIILRFLASNDVFSKTRYHTRYGLNPISKFLMQEQEKIKNHGVEHVGGSMFEAIPAVDAVFLKDDEKSVALLRKCHKAIPINGKVIIVEIDGGELMPLKLSLDMAMLLVIP
ncbi:hypothetical protein KI387_008481, partial [Taxus chinensis]